jgi:3D (Asp-Asp-Asp) domain-containing protein
MMQDEIFLNTRIGEASSVRKKRPRKGLWMAAVLVAIAIAFGAWRAYDVLWLQHRYLITAYCDCPICVNVKKFRDGKFASHHPVYWGGIAADKKIPFNSNVELLPVTPLDWFAVWDSLSGRRNFTVEDRGGKIKGRHLDIYIPQSRGGHQTALNWGVRRMRVKISGRLMP